MNKRELQVILDREGFRPNYYYLDGGLVPERITLAQEGSEWTVYFSEKGLKVGKRNFSTEDEACRYLLELLRRDSSAKAKTQYEIGLIENAPSVGDLCAALKTQSVIIIGKWTRSESDELFIQDFNRDGESFVPMFSDETHFRSETAGSGFEGDGITIRCELLISLLKGDELLILNPGSKRPVRLRKSDFA